MDDITYTFIETVRDRKAAARGAYHHRTGSRTKTCKLSSDTLTPAQIERRHGPVSTYTMNAPHTWKELKNWPEHVRHEYMSELLDKYDPTNVELGKMLGVSKDYICAVLPQCGITRGRGGKHTRSVAHDNMWYDFISGGEPIMPDPEPEPAPVVDAVYHKPEPAPKLTPILYDDIQLTFTGTLTDLVQCIVTGPMHLLGTDTCTFTIKATRN